MSLLHIYTSVSLDLMACVGLERESYRERGLVQTKNKKKGSRSMAAVSSNGVAVVAKKALHGFEMEGSTNQLTGLSTKIPSLNFFEPYNMCDFIFKEKKKYIILLIFKTLVEKLWCLEK